jgi:hypothetical protein
MPMPSGLLMLATCFWLVLLLSSKLLVEWGVSLTHCIFFAHFLRDVVFIKMATAVHCCAHPFPSRADDVLIWGGSYHLGW